MHLYLASKSPRRAELLAQIGVAFTVVDASIDERRGEGEPPWAYVVRLAREKASAGIDRAPRTGPRAALGADTIVVTGGEVLGKPLNRQQARSHLHKLSGTSHTVLTAVALAIASDDEHALAVDDVPVRTSRSRVWFDPLNDAQIDAYWDTGEPADKAGSYAIQGIAARYIARLEGSYSGVMGLPINETCQLLGLAGVLKP